MIPAWLRHLFVAAPDENARIAAAETAQDRREGRLPRTTLVEGYHSIGCTMRFEASRHHRECGCWCHR